MGGSDSISTIPTSRPPHAILQATIDDDLPELERAIHIMAASLADDEDDNRRR
jgi:hypothetical protein